MKLRKLVLVSLIAGVLVPNIARAQSLRVRRLMDGAERKIQTSAKRVNDYCGSSFVVKYDWQGAKNDDLAKHALNQMCEGAVDAIYHICNDDLGKEAVTRSIKKLICAFGEESIDLNHGTLIYVIENKSENDSVKVVKKFLEDNL